MNRLDFEPVATTETISPREEQDNQREKHTRTRTPSSPSEIQPSGHSPAIMHSMDSPSGSNHHDPELALGLGSVELHLQKPPLRSSPSISQSSRTDEPTTLAEALRALQEARDEISMLHARMADHEDSKPFESRGLDHTDAGIDESRTRNGRELAYANSTDPAVGESVDRGTTIWCGCIEMNNSSHHETMTVAQYFVTPFWRLLLKRLPWLVILLMLQSFSASILASYDRYLEAHIIFTYFVPMVVGTGGNAGNQCSVMVTRALALGMGDAEVWRVVKKEIPISCITAGTLGLFAFMRVAAEYPDSTGAAAAIAVTLGVSIMISILLGIFFSYGIEKFKRCDPADGATPLLSTISDLIGIALLCGVATAMVN